MCILVQIAVDGLSRPQGDVVEVDDVVVRTPIDQSPQLAVAYGQRLFKEVGRTVVLQYHRWLFLSSSRCDKGQPQATDD